MNWYNYEHGVFCPRIQNYLVCFYDEYGNCYDEARYKPKDIDLVIPFVADEACRVFAIFSKDELYELLFVK